MSHSQSRGRKSSFGQLPRPEPDLDKRLKKEIKDLEQTFATIDVEEEPITQFNRVVGQRSWLLEKDFKLGITVRHFEFGGQLESVKSIWTSLGSSNQLGLLEHCLLRTIMIMYCILLYLWQLGRTEKYQNYWDTRMWQ